LGNYTSTVGLVYRSPNINIKEIEQLQKPMKEDKEVNIIYIIIL